MLHLSPVSHTGASCSLPYPVIHTPHPAVQAVALDPRLPHASACLPCDPQEQLRCGNYWSCSANTGPQNVY